MLASSIPHVDGGCHNYLDIALYIMIYVCKIIAFVNLQEIKEIILLLLLLLHTDNIIIIKLAFSMTI